jgi:subtilisin family serine protease
MASKKQKSPGYTQADYSIDAPDYVIAELRYDSGIAVTSANGFRAAEASMPDATRLNDVLAGFKVQRVAPHFELPQRVLAERADAIRSARAKVSSDYAKGGFVQIVPEKSADAAAIAKRLDKSDSVWTAYVAPRPVPASINTGTSTGSRNFEPAQGYLHSAPNGIGAAHLWSTAGGRGRGITVCDIEGNWNFKHEDLPAGIDLIGGTVINDIDWRNHGTAVLGEIVSKAQEFGTVGIARDAKAVVHSAVINNVFNTAGAIAGASAKLKAGDVILIELQATGPNNKYVAMQYWPDVFAAIVAATAKGITVVEAAGNGNENFNLPIFSGGGLQKDSGAIVVGAGIPPTDFFDVDGAYAQIGVPRSRIWFSNYGKIVNVQGWGWHVTTCGYGDAQGSTKEERWYTHRFSGTSSASPIVTGAVACLQGIAKASSGSPLTPAKVRTILMKSGTPQAPGPGVPLSQHIGPQPNLQKAVTMV